MLVFYEWIKVCGEFFKRLDPDLPFYYHTTSDRLYEGNMPAFDEPSEKPKQPKWVPCRELVRADVSGRVTMAIRGDHSYPNVFLLNYHPSTPESV